MKKAGHFFAVGVVLVAAVVGINVVWADTGVKQERVPLWGETAQAVVQRKAAQAEEKHYERPRRLQNTKELMLYKSQFIISYHVDRLCPNYVCWSLTTDRVKGKVQRSNNFHADPAVDERKRVEHYDYNGSGYDRGHMCPAGDNKNNIKAMDESFCMTNMCPQNHNLNTGAWNDLEVQCRSWARNYGTLYICCGPIFDSGKLKTIGRRKNMKVAVPDRFFKVVLTMGRMPKAIGFIYPNRSCSGDMRDYAVSVDEVERVTGMDFFYQLEDKQENALEKVCNPSAWGI